MTRTLQDLMARIDEAVGQAGWEADGPAGARGSLAGGLYTLSVSVGGSAQLVCEGLGSPPPEVLLAANSALRGPSRMQMTLDGAGSLAASWPLSLPTDAQARLLASDLRWLLGSGDTPAVPGPLDAALGRRVRGIVAHCRGYREVPGPAGSCQFAVGTGPAALQVTARCVDGEALVLSTLVTGWRTRPVPQAAAALLLMLNSRLRWVRLVDAGTTVDAQVTLPQEALSQSAWRLAHGALVQAVSHCRAALRLVQAPLVATAFARMHLSCVHNGSPAPEIPLQVSGEPVGANT